MDIERKIDMDMYNIYYKDVYQCTVWCSEEDKSLFTVEFEDQSKVEMVKWQDDQRKQKSLNLT
jgi:hypothetical protein